MKNSAAISGEGLCVATSVAGQVVAMNVGVGRIRWQRKLDSHPHRWVFRSPVVSGDCVLAGEKQGYTLFDLASGEQVWSISLDWFDAWPCYATALTFEDVFVVPVQRRGILALSRDDGSIVWENDTPVEYHHGAPVQVDDVAVLNGGEGCLVAIDLSTGETLWREPALNGAHATGIAVHGDVAYTAAFGGHVQAFALSGRRRLWSFQTGPDLLDLTPYGRGTRSTLAKPVLLGDELVAGGCDGWLYALDASTGDPLRRAFLGAPVTAIGIAADGVCVTTTDGVVRLMVRQR